MTFHVRLLTLLSSIGLVILGPDGCSGFIDVDQVKGECFPVGDRLPSNGIPEDYSCFSTRNSPAIPCKNEHERCDEWKGRGECKKNPAYMLYNCRKACETCVHLHASDGVLQLMAHDRSKRDDFLQKLVETQQYVYDEAATTPQIIQTCKNKHELCTQWAIRGECESNKGYMHEACAAVCKTCA